MTKIINAPAYVFLATGIALLALGHEFAGGCLLVVSVCLVRVQ
jgi:hypothetical protein